MGRHALLIGVSEFVDERLARLNAPIKDVTKLQEILRDTNRGRFDSVELSANENFLEMRDRLSRFYHGRAPDDMLLLYYSGHGILGRGNRLFLATAGSNLDAPRERSISANEIREFIGETRAQGQIVVLDCCHSGAFVEHNKAGAPAPAVTPDTFSSAGTGLYVLTAADALQYAWDGAELRLGNASNKLSLFTSWLVEGLETGEAAPDDEEISINALYQYLFGRARSEGAASTPQLFVREGVGDLVISANPLAGSSRIDPKIVAALRARAYLTRLGAVHELSSQILEGSPLTAHGARQFLQQRLQIETHYRVREAIERALVGQGAKLAEEQANQQSRPVGATQSLVPPVQQGDSQLADLAAFRDAPYSPELVVIPAGEFIMGSSDTEEERYQYEGPQHHVTIGQRFAIGRYPVTFDEYDRFCEAKGLENPDDSKTWERRPVTNVSWEDAQAYIAWLSQETGRAYRLPSEAEWEYACRAGTATRYSFGNVITAEYANYSSSGLGRASEVGAYPPNLWGLHDMHGNVMEWVEDDWHENYLGAPSNGSAWKNTGAGRNLRVCVTRGAYWANPSSWCRSAYRSWEFASRRVNYYGFRVARTLCNS
jgi:formylglycine-generating enzyme required for sulfatase activity